MPEWLPLKTPVFMRTTRANQLWNGDAERKKTCAIIQSNTSFSGLGVVKERMALTDTAVFKS